VGKASRDKGKRGEREAIKDILRPVFGATVRRGSQSRNGGKDEPDAIGLPSWLAVEVKRLARRMTPGQLVATYDKLIDDCAHARLTGRDPDLLPMILHRADGAREWSATFDLEDIVEQVGERPIRRGPGLSVMPVTIEGTEHIVRLLASLKTRREY
jgi:hypothetical protein